MALAMTDAIPLMESDGTTGRNNARDIRTQLLTALSMPDSSTGARPGVIPRRYVPGSDFVDLRAIQLGTPGQAVQLYPGRCLISRTGQGPYLVTQETTVTNYPFGAADVTNPRYDLMVARLYDAAIGDVGNHGPMLDHIVGTPLGSPTVPALPADGAIPIAAIYRPAGVNAITNANITDLRKSAAWLGTLRQMLPGDALSDAGLLVGERRVRITPSGLTALGAPPFLVDVWGADSAWHGTQELSLGPVTQVGSGTLPVGGNGTTIASVTIPDPGWAYRIESIATMGWAVAAATSPGQLLEVSVTVDSTVWTTNVLSGGFGVSHSTGAGFNQQTIGTSPERSDHLATTYTGSKVIRLMARNTGAGNMVIPAAARDIGMSVRIVPA